MNFSEGDLAVYPGHGVGKVVAVEQKEIMGAIAEFYSIELLENSMRIMIPKDTAIKKGLRPIVSKEEAEQVMAILKNTDTSDIKRIDNQTWNRRYREYMEKIKTGSVLEIAQVLRELVILKVDKELSFGERKMLDTARGLLIKELSLATNNAEASIESEVSEVFQTTAVEA